MVIEKREDFGPLAQTNAEAEALWCLGELQAVLAAGEHTGDGFSLVEHEALAGHSPPWHRQPGDDETFYVLEGEMTFWAGDSGRPYQRVGRGAMVFIPRGLPHSFRVESETARWLTVGTPAGHERFYRAVGETAKQHAIPPPGKPDMAKVDAGARSHGVELLGPPPSSQPAH